MHYRFVKRILRKGTVDAFRADAFFQLSEAAVFAAVFHHSEKKIAAAVQQSDVGVHHANICVQHLLNASAFFFIRTAIQEHCFCHGVLKRCVFFAFWLRHGFTSFVFC